MRIPLEKKSYAIQMGAVISGPKRAAVFGGPRPRKPQPRIGHLIVIGGPREGLERYTTHSEPFFVELDATKGNWHVEPQGDFLNISFDGLKAKVD
jgi:hypothetical protein